jgi:hypothetical protein
MSQFQNVLMFIASMQLLYTLGGIDNLRTARKYYSAAIELSAGQNMRALYGVCLVCVEIHEIKTLCLLLYANSLA